MFIFIYKLFPKKNSIITKSINSITHCSDKKLNPIEGCLEFKYNCCCLKVYMKKYNLYEEI